MMGTCEGYTCPVEHRAPHKVVSSQDAGRGRSAEKLAIAAMVHVRMHWRASRTGRHRDRCRESMATVRVQAESSRNSELEHQICVFCARRLVEAAEGLESHAFRAGNRGASAISRKKNLSLEA